MIIGIAGGGFGLFSDFVPYHSPNNPMLGSSTRNRGPSGGSDQAGPSSGYKPLQDPDKTPRLTTGSLPGEVGQHDIDSGREGGREEKAVTLEERKWTMSGSNVALHFYEY